MAESRFVAEPSLSVFASAESFFFESSRFREDLSVERSRSADSFGAAASLLFSSDEFLSLAGLLFFSLFFSVFAAFSCFSSESFFFELFFFESFDELLLSFEESFSSEPFFSSLDLPFDSDF